MNFSENFLYHIWDGQHLAKEITTISGNPVRIMFQGQWNTGAGPDFRNAVIQIGEEVCRGDVEIHKNSYDWIQHNHNEDPGYNNVILHVVFKHNAQYPYTLNEAGEKIEILQIENFLDQDISKLLIKYGSTRFDYTPKEKCLFFVKEDFIVFETLHKLGIRRFERKIKRYSAELFFSDFEQLVYQGIFEALGYSKNKYPFYRIASELTISELRKFKKEGMSKDQMIAILLNSTGLIRLLPKSFPSEYRNKWISLYTEQNFSKNDLKTEWTTFRIRPGNHPAIRVIQISGFLYSALDDSLFRRIVSCFSTPEKVGVISDRFYHLLKDENEILPTQLGLGKARSDEIFINVILPLTALYAQKMNFPALESLVRKAYYEFPGLAGNYINSTLECLMNQSQKKIISNKTILQQGTIQLYFDFCRQHECQLCTANCNEIISGWENAE
ncbi:MAG: DUF2851 family protein [Candidatus Cloacimonetes bacterium]|nr:DUF2851 family protein [Candidatus Cloacimonadota bacterium]